MSFIRTLLGDISPQELGVCNAHDHILRSGGEEVKEDADFMLDSVDASKKEMSYWLAAGGKSVIDMNPIACGRNVPKTLEVAEAFRGKAHIVMTTGFQKSGFYCTRTHWLNTIKDMDKIVELLAAEIEIGLDKHSYNGPVVERVSAKAGIIKAGTSYSSINSFELRALQAAALTQKKTGCPISVHTQQGTMAMEVVENLTKFGADLTHVALCHVQKNPDKYHHLELMRTGANICYDGPDRAKYFPDSYHAENIKWLVEKGFQKQILLSMDAGRASYQRAYMELKGKLAHGVAYLLDRFVPLLRSVGVPEDAITDMLVRNPARVFSFITK
jgi:phosphotriesterase-related protein